MKIMKCQLMMMKLEHQLLNKQEGEGEEEEEEEGGVGHNRGSGLGFTETTQKR